MRRERVAVLVVGGGLCGMSMAVFLAWHGVPVRLVERYPSALNHPRARTINPRTTELFRQVGLEDAIIAGQSFGHREPAVFVRAGTLAGPELGRGVVSTPAGPAQQALSPCPWVPIDQDRLEGVLRAHAERLGADIRFGTELTEFTQDASGVTAVVRDVVSGERTTLSAAYLVAADGHGSGVRQRLGLSLRGYGGLGNLVSLVFAADLTAALRGRDISICHLDQPEVGTVLLPHDRASRWVFSTPYHPERGERLADLTEQRCVELIRAAIGQRGLEVTLMPQLSDGTKVLGYELGAGVVDRYSVGPVFLVGDAAHVMPPSGAFGAGTGIQDAHNLAWKLAAVLAGEAPAELLDTYGAERRPVALFTVDQSLLQLRARSGRELPGVPQVEPADYFAVVFGHRYHSALISPDPPGPTGPADPTGPRPAVLPPAQLRGAPGTRAPHVPLLQGGERISTIDLYGRQFVLLAGPEGGRWADAAGAVAARQQVRLRAYRIGVDLLDPDGGWAAAHDATPAGAVLVRPDGVVAWRARAAAGGDPAATLARALDRACGRPVHAPANPPSRVDRSTGTPAVVDRR